MIRKVFLFSLCALTWAGLPLSAQEECREDVVAHVRVDPGHPWRPPFGLDRVGQPLTALVEVKSDQRLVREYSLVGYLQGKEVDRFVLTEINHQKKDQSSYFERAEFDTYPDELALFAQCRFQGKPEELVREKIQPPAFEADAEASPEQLINPVDLGMVLFPADWLLLVSGQKAVLDVAALSRQRDLPDARVTAWLESAPGEKSSERIRLSLGQRARVSLRLAAPSAAERDILHVGIEDSEGKEIWQKKIQTSRVNNPPHWPAFGATYTKLRFDPPISVRDFKTGALSTKSYENAWKPELRDVVVSLPNGSRFVFWRGSSYVPFWAGKHDTGLSYEWAETTPPPGGFVDSVEPLMDKELRYGRVEIIESTPARVHVRWTYQSCDFLYKVWGDEAAEDFYFYPDGYGTRVLTLKHGLGVEYELSELIILSPQAAFPFSFLPSNIVDLLFVDGAKREVFFPYPEDSQGKRAWPPELAEKAKGTPIIYCVHPHKDEKAAAIYFNPMDTQIAPIIYAPFFDRGVMVTPAYWGSHWPLSRGKSTGWTIDDRIYVSPAHNSVITWGLHARPRPIRSAEIETLDTLGHPRRMSVERWAWLIAMNEDSSARLLEWARSFSKPPSVELKGGRFELNAYASDRRAIRIIVDEPAVAMTITPTVPCVNPVFELSGATGTLQSVTLAGRTLKKGEYAWDGHTLWIGADLTEPESLQLKFEERSASNR